MKKKLAAAMLTVPMTFVGTMVAGEGTAHASWTVTVCKREVQNPFGGWECVEWTTCIIEGDLYFCDDGTSGSNRPPRGTPVPIRPIAL